MNFQAPKGTRDFYPSEMAWRNYLFDTWRKVAIRHGFEQVDGPIYESLDLYKVKSGSGIVSELFHFLDRGGRELAIRPEFTPTLARMVAQRANALSKPIKWFSTPNLCRAERPQRGRLREHFQWNCDILGTPSPIADAECLFVAIDLLRELGLGPHQVQVKISHRLTVRHILSTLGVADESMTAAFELLDRRAKIEPQAFADQAGGLGLDPERIERFDQICRVKCPVGDLDQLMQRTGIQRDDLSDLAGLDEQLRSFGIEAWCEYDLSVVRGLAYYTGTVFEVFEVSGAERAMAGGGRYDQLIELFSGPAMPAVGFGMGDVVLTNVLIDKGLMPEDVSPCPDVFVIAPSDEAAESLPGLVARLRSAGVHSRFSYKATRHKGKLLKEAAAARARFALILEDGGTTAALKDLSAGEQEDSVPLDDLQRLAQRLAGSAP